MDAMGSRVRGAARRSSASAMQITRQITVRAARRKGACWRTAACRACWERTGRARWTNWRAWPGAPVKMACARPPLSRNSGNRKYLKVAAVVVVKNLFHRNERERGDGEG